MTEAQITNASNEELIYLASISDDPLVKELGERLASKTYRENG